MTKVIFQEILKVLLVVYTIFILGAMLFITVESFYRTSRADWFDYLLLILAFIAGVLSVIFHIKTYPYYNKITRKRTIPKIFWVGSLVLPVYVIYIILETMLNYFSVPTASIYQDFKGFIIVLLVLVISVLSILETLFMYKRVQQQHEHLALTEELDTIGDSPS